MKSQKSFYALLILAIVTMVFSCNQSKEGEPNMDDFKNLHFIVERTHPDTVKTEMNAFYSKYEIPVTAAKLPEGHYSAESTPDDYHYRHIISFDVKDGLFKNVEYDEIKYSGASKTDEVEYNKKMNENIMGSAPEITYPAYEKQVEEKQNLLAIDAISGATYTKYRLQLVAAKAIVNGPDKQ